MALVTFVTRRSTCMPANMSAFKHFFTHVYANVFVCLYTWLPCSPSLQMRVDTHVCTRKSLLACLNI